MTKNYKYLPVITGIFVTCLIVSNIVAIKLIQVGPFTLSGALLIFSISYIFGDILTEVYGYARARQVIWIGFGCNLLAVFGFYTAGIMPASPYWSLPGFDTPQAAQRAYDAVLGFTPVILTGSFIAYLVGEFLNSLVLAKMKIATEGRWLWMRTIASTLIAQVADTGIFWGVLFIGGLISTDALLPTIMGEWASKVLYEIVATPLTYPIVNFLKRAENEDYYDRETNFNPIALQ